MYQCESHKPTAAQRLSSLLAAIGATAMLIGGQLGIASGYTARADAQLATKSVEGAARQTAASAARGPST